GHVVRWGDQDEVLVLGLWASEANLAPNQLRLYPVPVGQNQIDVNQYIRDVANTAAWKSFMRTATVATGIALRCGRPVFSHSGGGAVLAMVLRILDLKVGRARIAGWSTGLSVGLEHVFSTQLRDNLTTNLAF